MTDQPTSSTTPAPAPGAGPQDPRTGGVIIARGARDELEAHLADDPYVTHGLVEVDITPFAAVTLAPALSA